MKYLSDYTQEGTTKLLAEYGAFFAFGNEQFNEQKKDGIEYVSLGMGLICPKEHAKAMTEGMVRNYEAAVQQDLTENGKEAIIKRELSNHECYYTGDVSDAVEALRVYGFEYEDIYKVYQDNLQFQDL